MAIAGEDVEIGQMVSISPEDGNEVVPVRLTK